MYVGMEKCDLIDSELGRFVRKFAEFELLLRNVAVTTNAGMTWSQASVLRISDLLSTWVEAADRFPAEDRDVLRQSLEAADEVIKLRHLMVHGRWFEVDASRGHFMVELPLTNSAARKFEAPSTWPEGAHPATVMPMNPATIARAWRIANTLVTYMGDNIDRWQVHFRAQPQTDDAQHSG